MVCIIKGLYKCVTPAKTDGEPEYCQCCTSVDQDVNVVENMRRTSAVARYGLKVQACPDEARRGWA